MSALPAIADAVGDRVDLLLDGGVRSGLDVVKAISLGARSCMIGRPWAYAVAARGERGVSHVLEIIKNDLEVALALTGVTDVRKLDASVLVREGA